MPVVAMSTTTTNLFAAAFGEFSAVPAAVGVGGRGNLRRLWSAWQKGVVVAEVTVAVATWADECKAELVDKVIIKDGGKVLFMFLLFLAAQCQIQPLSPQN